MSDATALLRGLLDQAVVVDFETYYGPKCSLSSLSYTDYIEHNDFFVRGAGICAPNEEARWVPAYDVSDRFPEVVVVHNGLFDLTVAKLVYDITPRFVLDTQWLATLLYGQTLPSMSLDALCGAFGLGTKSEGLKETYGARDLSPEVQAKLEAYACNDAALCLRLLHHLMRAALDVYTPEFLLDELQLMNLTMRMLTHPRLQVDVRKLQVEADGGERARRIARVAATLGVSEAEVPKLIRSRKRFAGALTRFGVEPPVKISPCTGESTFAFGKNDEGMRRLASLHSHGPLADLIALKTELSSTIAESRAGRLVRLQEAMWGRFGVGAGIPVHISYYGARQTGRWSGTNKLNLQNLQRKSVLRDALVPPSGHKLLIADFEQIEARVLAWLCGHHDLIAAFARGEDVYVRQARRIWATGEIDVIKRFVGKVCVLGLGYGASWAVLEHLLRMGTMGPAFIFDEAAARGLGVEFPQGELPPEHKWTDEKRDLVASSPELIWHFAACARLVSCYRTDNDPIKRFWYACDMTKLTAIGEGVIFDRLPFRVQGADLTFRLPSGRLLTYHDIDLSESNATYALGNERVHTYGSKIVENITQAVARDVLAASWLRVAQADRHAGCYGWLIPVLSVHDELVFVVPEQHAAYLSGIVTGLMRRSAPWMDGLPLGVKTSVANNYGEK